MPRHQSNAAYRLAAHNLYHTEGETEVDENAPVSKADGNPDHGAYVQAWVWVGDDDAREAAREARREATNA